MNTWTATAIDSNEDIIDSRDVIARIEYLRALAEETPPDIDDDERAELTALEALAEQCNGYGDWEYGEALIRKSHFRDYAEQLAEDIGAIPEGAAWPVYCIDWEQAARELSVDYMEVDFDGVSYLMRA